jgi:hypothetical protein
MAQDRKTGFLSIPRAVHWGQGQMASQAGTCRAVSLLGSWMRLGVKVGFVGVWVGQPPSSRARGLVTRASLLGVPV